MLSTITIRVNKELSQLNTSKTSSTTSASIRKTRKSKTKNYRKLGEIKILPNALASTSASLNLLSLINGSEETVLKRRQSNALSYSINATMTRSLPKK